MQPAGKERVNQTPENRPYDPKPVPPNSEIIESALPGTRFALQNAEDPDIGVNSDQTYKLSDNRYFTLSERMRPDGSTFPELI
ncbi:unnamed protein product [Ranitomeya imitator]|uniref:Uncharacterized protein n=1 Tax=Ranitomeya imitator TaxID=111125 RepID=A0ABN9LF95_9NEOB|nr:unnamed protein product [Ranitomeya imitator]